MEAERRMPKNRLKELLDDPTNGRAITQFTAEFFVNVLIRGRQILGNDFDAVIVLLTIQTYVGEKAFRTNEQNVRKLSFNDPYPEELLVPISRLAIANITGLPRETVRRKVALLEKLGMVRKVGTRGILISYEFALGPQRAELALMSHAQLRRLLDRTFSL